MKSPSLSPFIVYPLYVQNLELDKRLILLDKNSLLYLCRYPALFPTQKVAYRGGCVGVQTHPPRPEILKTLQNSAKLNPICEKF